MSSYRNLFIFIILSLSLIQVRLYRDLTLKTSKYGGLAAGETQYYDLKVNRTQIGSDALAFKVNGIREFADPDVIIAVNQQVKEFNITANALKVCQSWGQDVCILQNQEIIKKQVENVNIAVFCQYQCDFSIVVERLGVQRCIGTSSVDTVLTPQERLYSHQCLATFDNETDIRAVQFYVPSLDQYPNAKNIKHLTFIAHNNQRYGRKNSPKIDLWVAPGNNIPQSDCSCRRGYTLFSRSIGTRVSGDRIKLGSNYTMLIQQIIPNQSSFDYFEFTTIEMLVELDKQVVEIGQTGGTPEFFTTKQGIVDQNQESCFKYKVSKSDSDMIVTLRVHTGFGTLYIGAGASPKFENQQYKADAYYQNDSEIYSFEQISPLERGMKGKSGYQYLCFYGSRASTFTIQVREQPHNVGVRMIGGNKKYEYEIQQDDNGDNTMDLMFVSADVKKLEDLKFRITSKNPYGVDMFVKPCDLIVDRNAEKQQSFTVVQDENGRVFADFSMFKDACKPTKQQIQEARKGSQTSEVQMATNAGFYSYQMQITKQVKIKQECQGAMVPTKGTNINVNVCGYWIHLINNIQAPQRVRLQTSLYADDYEMVLNEQKIQTFQLNRQFDLYLTFSVGDTTAKQIRIEIDPIHGDTDMYVSKWKKPTLESSMFKSTRCGRVPDVITITQVKIKQFMDEDKTDDKDGNTDKNNPLVGQYYILIRALQDSTFNIVYSVKSSSLNQDDSQISLSSIVHLQANRPFSATLTTSHMLFIFNGDFHLESGEDIKISVSNVDTNQVLQLYATPSRDIEHPPAKVEDYKYRSTILHPNYIILQTTDNIDLTGSFYIRVQRNKKNIQLHKNGVKFRINVMTGKNELSLRNGQSEQAFILPKESKVGAFFVYYQLNPENDLHIILNRLNGENIKMFVGVGVKFPSAEGDKIQTVEQGQYLKLNKKKIEELNPDCKTALAARSSHLFGSDEKVTRECSIHIGVFPKALQIFLSKQIDFSIKVMQENTINLSRLIDGKSESGVFNKNLESPQLPESYTYSYKVPQFPHNGLYVTLVDFSKQNNKNLFFIAEIVPIDDQNNFSLTMLNNKSPEIGDKNSWSFKSSDFVKHHYLKISHGSFKQKYCDTKACYVLITVCSNSSEFDQKYQILVTSKVQSLADQSIIYGDVSPGSYSYFIYHNSCQTCTVRFYLNTISPGSGDADMYINYSIYQNLQELPTTEDSHFGDATYKEDTLIIDKTQMLKIQKQTKDFTMAGYYLIGVYGGDKKKDQDSTQPMVHFSIRVSTNESHYVLLDQGISAGVKDANINQINYFLWKNWGAAHFNVYVTPTIGDVDIWVSTYSGLTLNDIEKYFPKSKEDAFWTSSKKGTRNKLQINSIQDSNEKKVFCIADCYFIIGVKNQLKTDYDVYVDTLTGTDTHQGDTDNHDIDDYPIVDKFLPLNSIHTETCWISKRTVYTVPFHRDLNDAKKMYLKISRSISFSKSMQYDIGTQRLGYDIQDDALSDYLQINLDKIGDKGESFNIYITLTCYDQIEYSIQVKKDWRVPVEITTNQPLTSTIYKDTMPDVYSFKYTHQMPTLQVSLLKRVQCNINLLIQIYPDDIFGLDEYHVPTQETAHYKLKSEKKQNYQMLKTQIDLSTYSLNSQIVFQVLYNDKEQEQKCPYTLQLDAGAVVKMLVEDVFYESSISEIVDQQNTLRKDKMRIFEIANPHFSWDPQGPNMLHVQVKPCDSTLIGVYVSHIYVEEFIELKGNTDNYTHDLSKGRLTLHLNANQPQYYIYVYKIDTETQQQPAYFFVRAFYGEKHKEYDLAQNGKIEIVHSNQNAKNDDSSKGIRIKWGPVYIIENISKPQLVESVKFMVKGQRGIGELKTQCELRASDAFVIAYLQNTYELFISFDEFFGDAEGITVNVEAIPIQQWTESILYEELYLQRNSGRSSKLWIYLTVVFGGLALFSIILAIVFRKNLKKTEKQLEFEMTDVRNVARVNAPSAAPYYNVEEEQEHHDNKSVILKDSKDEEEL